MIYSRPRGQRLLLPFLWPSSLRPVLFGAFLARKPLIFADVGPARLLLAVSLRLMGSQKRSEAYGHSRAQPSARGTNKFFFLKLLSAVPPGDLCSPHATHFFLTHPSILLPTRITEQQTWTTGKREATRMNIPGALGLCIRVRTWEDASEGGGSSRERAEDTERLALQAHVPIVTSFVSGIRRITWLVSREDGTESHGKAPHSSLHHTTRPGEKCDLACKVAWRLPSRTRCCPTE